MRYREIFLRGQLLAVIRSLFSLLFRCYRPLFFAVFYTAGFKKPEFLRLSEVPSLYFAGFISGISERSEASKSLG